MKSPRKPLKHGEMVRIVWREPGTRRRRTTLGYFHELRKAEGGKGEEVVIAHSEQPPGDDLAEVRPMDRLLIGVVHPRGAVYSIERLKVAG